MSVDFFGGTDGYGTFINNDLIIFDHWPQLFCNAQYVGQVGRAVFAGRGWQRQKDNFCVFDGLGQVGSETESILLSIALEEEFKALKVPFEKRGPITDESIEALRSLWSGGASAHAGEHYAWPEVESNPKPVNGRVDSAM